MREPEPAEPAESSKAVEPARPDRRRIRVVLVDDQALIRAGIAMVISSQDDMDLVGQAADGVEALEVVRRLRPDVVLMDVRMPRLDGIAATAALMGGTGPADPAYRPRVVVLTTYEMDEAVSRALQAGASGFLLKDAQPEFLLAALRTVHAGNAVIAPSATAALLARHTTPSTRAVAAPDPLEGLTAREREVFQLAARGLSNAEIAEREFVGEATVKTHLSRILAKLGLRDRVQLVVFAFEHGLVR